MLRFLNPHTHVIMYRAGSTQAADCLLDSKLFPLTSSVRYVSSYTYEAAYEARSLAPVAGYAAGTSVFSALVIQQTSQYKYAGGVLAPNGHIYMVPSYADNIGDFDPATGAFSVIDISGVISHDPKYAGGVLAPNGHVYMVPYSANSVGKLHLGSNEAAYKVAGGVPATWGALMSSHFNKY